MKLLHKSIRQLIGYALLIFAICVPLFYLIIEQLYIQDVDDALYFKRDKLRLKAAYLQTQHDIDLWLAMDDDVRVRPPLGRPHGDTVYFTQYLDSLPQEWEPYRELVTCMHIGQASYTLIVRASLVESRDLVIGIVEAQGILLLLLLAGWILLVRLRSRRTWRPFYATIEQLREYELNGGHQLQFDISDIREFNDLNKAIGELIDRNHQTYISQKKFIENASHEMQTPLAIFRSKLDNMIEGRILSAEESRDFQTLYEGVQRLHHLNKGLLILSKIENHQFDEADNLSVVALVRQSISFLQETIDHNSLSLHLHLHEDHIIRANETLFQLLVTNLLTNAVRHNQPGGSLAITLDPDGLHVANTGARLPFPEQELFTRFKKHAHPQKGVGLGLAIVKEIADKYHFPLQYTYASPLHQFSLYFHPIKKRV